MQTILFMDEHYLYLLKDKSVNQNNPNLRRINEIFDLNKLFDYGISPKGNGYEFNLDFLLEDNFLDRKQKMFLMEEKEAEIFENDLLDTLENIDSIYISENNEQSEEEEEEKEEEKDDKKNDEERKDKNANKIYFRNAYGFGDKKDNTDLKSSSRFIYKNIYV